MAEPVRPVSRHGGRIPSNTAAVVHNIPTGSAGVSRDYIGYDVSSYDKYARPTSQRSSMSGQQQQTDAPVPRPRTRGRRAQPNKEISTSSLTNSIHEQMKLTRATRGQRANGATRANQAQQQVTQQPMQTDEVGDRPKTSHGRRALPKTPVDKTPYTHGPAGSATEQQPGQDDISDRPKTSHGRQGRQPVKQEIAYNSKPPTGVPYTTTTQDTEARPTTSRGSRAREFNPSPPTDLPPRPQTRRSTRSSETDPDEWMGSPRSPRTQVDILNVEQERIHTARTRAHSKGSLESELMSPRSTGQADAHVLQSPDVLSLQRSTPIGSDATSNTSDSPCPTPEPRPKSRALRPKSAKGRVRPRPPPVTAADPHVSPTTVNTATPTDTPRSLVSMVSPASPEYRPPSSLSKYSPLPSIGSAKSRGQPDVAPFQGQGHTEGSAMQDTGPASSLATKKINRNSKLDSSDMINFDLLAHQAQHIQVPMVPSGGASAQQSPELMYKKLVRRVDLPPEPSDAEAQILLAVKLPSGERVQRKFRPTDTLEVVLNFAELSAQLDFTGVEMVVDNPRRIFRDLTRELADCAVENRTVLHVQVPENMAP